MEKIKLLSLFFLFNSAIFAQSLFENDTIYHPVLSDSGRLFSISVAADMNHVIVGANADSHDENEMNRINKSGAVLYYQKDKAGNYVFKQKIVPSNREVKGYFGYNADISGNSMIVGAEDDKVLASTTIDRSGAVYFFNYENNKWVEKARFQDPDSTNTWGQEWGKYVAISGDYAVVGDRSNSFDENGMNNLPGAGAVFVYKKDANGNWSFFQKLVANDRSQVAQCGLDVDMYGDFIAMGCENNKTDTAGNYVSNSLGAVYIFEMIGGKWKQTQKVLPPVTGDHGNFAGDIQISDNYLVVSDRYNDYDENELNYINQTGAVQIYERQNNKFVFQQKIVASDRLEGDLFGEVVSLDGRRLAVHSTKNIKGHTVLGKSYLFAESGGTWTEIVGLEPAYRDSTASHFGTYNCLAWSGNDILHSNPGAHRINGKIRDAVYVYRSSVTSVESIASNSIQFSLYPNPVNDELNVTTDLAKNTKLDYIVISIDGRIVLSGSFETGINTSTIEVSSLQKGIYILNIFNDQGESGRLRFIKE